MKLPAYSNSAGIYIHIPFCRSKCIYCAFYSITREDLINRFVNALIKELELQLKTAGNRRFSTVYIGGGTPSVLSSIQISEILNHVFKNFSFSDEPEVTIEANPESVSFEKAKIWREIGINRVSLGVQSANDDELRFLGRIHDVKTAGEAIKALKKAGFENINVDLIFGIPGQSIQSFKSSLEWAMGQDVTHISTYSLTVEEGTVLFEKVKKGEVKLPDEERMREFYRVRDEILHNAGFIRYEISNFARPGFESKHNRIYWFHGEYLGFGPSAASFIHSPRPMRWQNEASISGYIKNLEQGKLPPSQKEYLTKEKLLLERIFLYIRTDRGLPADFVQFVIDKDPSLGGFFSSNRLNFEGMMVADSLALQIYDIVEPYIDEVELTLTLNDKNDYTNKNFPGR